MVTKGESLRDVGAQGTHEKNVSKLLRLSWEAEKIKPKQGKSANEAVKAGFAEDKVLNVMGGFEGGKVKCKSSAYCGWRNEGLPWSYSLDKKLVYQPDLAK